MKLGVVFPQTEIGSDPGGVRAYAEAAEEMGYNHIIVFDHVLGANAESRPGWSGAYRHTDAFHEPFVLYGFLAAVTSSRRAGHSGHNPTAASDGSRRQAGCCS